jgi:hypothetical protein
MIRHPTEGEGQLHTLGLLEREFGPRGEGIQNMQFDFQALGRELHERRNEAVVVPFVARSLSEWRPDEGECHRNCDWWALHNQGARQLGDGCFLTLGCLGLFGSTPTR